MPFHNPYSTKKQGNSFNHFTSNHKATQPSRVLHLHTLGGSNGPSFFSQDHRLTFDLVGETGAAQPLTLHLDNGKELA